jgi:hypothetical protein
MNQPENDTIPIEFGADTFEYPGKVMLVAEDVMELFKNEIVTPQK